MKQKMLKQGRRIIWSRGMTEGEMVKVYSSPGIKENELLDLLKSPLFSGWSESISPSIAIKCVKVVSIDYKPNGESIFAKLLVEAYDKSGRRLPGVVFLRGGSVAILPILTSKETGRRYVVFVKQPRLAVGQDALVEIPAGMLDGKGDFIGVAAKEFREEVGLQITYRDLICLSPRPPVYREEHLRTNKYELTFRRGIYVSPGVSDETMLYFLYRKELPGKEIESLEGKLTGNAVEHESIRLMIVPLDDAPRMTCDSKFFCAWALAKLQKLI